MILKELYEQAVEAQQATTSQEWFMLGALMFASESEKGENEVDEMIHELREFTDGF